MNIEALSLILLGGCFLFTAIFLWESNRDFYRRKKILEKRLEISEKKIRTKNDLNALIKIRGNHD